MQSVDESSAYLADSPGSLTCEYGRILGSLFGEKSVACFCMQTETTSADKILKC